MFDEFDPGHPMMLTLLVGLFLTIVWVDLQQKTYFALSFASIIGFYIILGVISFRYHCAAKDAILSGQTADGD
ncbi:hypothetical protein [Halocatena pleomorpha]|uniref:hypothetical protein n=1 Tax=Halocatena pleomorpha TaxID=1785090 RepID=UPI000F610FBB|nr:hypothetical protein [Halocatena pleomorpha]